MARLDVNRFAQGTLIGVLAVCLVITGVALQWLKPHFTKSVEAELVQAVREQVQPSTPAVEVTHEKVSATTVVGESLQGPRTQDEGWQRVDLATAHAQARLPADWKVEQKPGGLTSLAGDGATIDVLTMPSAEEKLGNLVQGIADAAESTPYVGGERGERAQGPDMLVVGFEQDSLQVLFSITAPNVAELEYFEAVVDSFVWNS